MAGEDKLELKEMNFNEILSFNNVDMLESKMLKHEQVQCNVIHRFGPGTYIREVHLPKDQKRLPMAWKKLPDHLKLYL